MTGLALLLAACTPPSGDGVRPEKPGVTTESAPLGKGPESPGSWRETLIGCPDDRMWARAVEELDRDEELDRLAEIVEEARTACPGRWEPHWASGEVLYRQHPQAPRPIHDELARHWNQAAATAEAGGDPAGISRASNRLSTLHSETGDLDAAESAAKLAVSSAIDAGREDLESLAYRTLAGVFRSQARLKEAFDSLGRAEELSQRAGDERTALRLRYGRAILLEDIGQLAREQEILEAVHADAERLGADAMFYQSAVAMGNSLLLHGDFEEARRWFDKIPSDHPQAVNVALGLGRIALRREEYDEALRYLEHASSSSKPTFSLWSRRVRAHAELLSGRPQAAIASLEGVIADAGKMGASETEALANATLGKCWIRMKRPREAQSALRRAVELIENSGAGLDPADGMTFLRERYEPYVELAAVLSEEEEPPRDEILRVIESAHARALRQLLGGEDAPSLPVPSIRELQGRLGPRQMLVDYLIGDDRGVAVVLTREEVRVSLIPGWTTLRPAIGSYRAALTRPLRSYEALMEPMKDLERDLDLGRQLRLWLLGDAEDLIAVKERLYIVPDQDLALLPFAALPGEGAGFLGEELEVANLPLASIGAATKRSRGPLLLAGDPVGNAGDEFGPLPMAAAELDAIAGVWRGQETQRLSGAELTAARLQQLPLDQFGTLHLATHAVASSRDPLRCAVILSGGDRLGVRELAQMQLGSSLVVLSACRTGGGEVVPGEGVVGLTWALLQAGAREIVASLWTVEDEATKYLMVAFHESLRAGADPVTALNRAQAVTRSARPHPVFWAPFVVILSPAAD